jgi:hypothetical protein
MTPVTATWRLELSVGAVGLSDGMMGEKRTRVFSHQLSEMGAGVKQAQEKWAGRSH